ncbi:hypothetical protein C5167_007156 [Papaver somniferum]|uniref:Mitochondrial carrier protein n=1 Tax=Papaver somniferum TaxID=3469 RepID=A0A4Y7JH35_PAPSO|nr:mitochondrial substrate carrier family protein E-like [Papaver somniferum]RZC59846.1 hypothetical protein C5167_007156 [Papaver somniferum]
MEDKHKFKDSSQVSVSSFLNNNKNNTQFFVWKEFLFGAAAGGFGEGMMHPIDTIKTRMQSQAILSEAKPAKSILEMVRKVWAVDGYRGLYRGVTPALTGSLATGATYFGVIESTKKWIEELHPNLGGHWAYFIAGGAGDTLGSFIYVPCEVVKQRMQVQGTKKSWSSMAMKENVCQKSGGQMYVYYSGIFQAGSSIWKQQGLRGLYAGYWSTLARDVPFAGLMVTFYESLRDFAEYGKQRWLPNSDIQPSNSVEGLLLGGLAGGFSAYLTTPLDVIKTRLQVQGPIVRYKGWLDAVTRIWMIEGGRGLFRGSVPRVIWYVPASALTFMAVEFLRDTFGTEVDSNEVTNLSIDKTSTTLPEVA